MSGIQIRAQFVSQSCVWVLSSFHRVQLFATLWTIALQVPLSMGFSRQEYWEWVATSFSNGSSRPRDWTHISYVFCIISSQVSHLWVLSAGLECSLMPARVDIVFILLPNDLSLHLQPRHPFPRARNIPLPGQSGWTALPLGWYMWSGHQFMNLFDKPHIKQVIPCTLKAVF